ncbi:hypothetical protein ACIQJT_02265 [Streptomyces sp. NPDC091972]|uniref:hypothetical protein n=1 Tax=Streptomyces sp. NPDC091972 TaxID=3366007 RepID=UPI0037F2DE80
MARTVGVTPDRLQEAGRAEAAEILREILRSDSEASTERPTLTQELELAGRLMAAQVRELGLSPDEAEEAWERARAQIIRTHRAGPTGEREDGMEGPRGRRSVG